MSTVIMTGWDESMNKVGLTKLQQKYLNLGLKEAKRNTERVLDGKPVVLEFSCPESAAAFVQEATAIHVRVAHRAE